MKCPQKKTVIQPEDFTKLEKQLKFEKISRKTSVVVYSLKPFSFKLSQTF